MYCQGHLQSTLCRWPGDLFSRTLSGHHKETSTAGSKCQTGMGNKEWFQVCSPQVQSRTLHYTPVSGSETTWGLETHFCRWRSPRSSLGCGETRTSHLRSTSVCWRHSTRRFSTSSKWSLTWNGEGTETHSWCCTVPLFIQSLTMVALCMAQRQTPTYDNWTAFITLDWDWHWEHSAPAQCPAYTQRPTKLAMHYYVETCSCIDNPAHHALHEFDRTTRDLYAPRPNGRGGMTRPLAPPFGLKVEEAMTSAEINTELVCPLRKPTFHQERTTMIPRDMTSLKE